MQQTSHSDRSDIYERLMAISEEALESAHYETAYHALTAAMHYAEDIGDEQRLARVEQVAKAQRDWIDSRAPQHRMSTHWATQHQHKGLYQTLIQQAAAQILIVQHKNRRDSKKHLPWLGDKTSEIS